MPSLESSPQSASKTPVFHGSPEQCPPLLKSASIECITDSSDLNNEQPFFSFIEHVLTFQAPIDGKAMSMSLDFGQGQVAFRREHGGGRKQHIAKACGLKHNWNPNILDATAGLGRDAAELRALGCSMRLIERSPYVAALLDDAISRAKTSTELFATGFTLYQGQAIELMKKLSAEQQPDIIYLDPMFPPKQKSAAVKKEMRLVKLLVGADEDADDLLPCALELAKYRVVVKRPSYAPFLNEQKPSMSIESKGNRFDVYVLQGIK